MSAWPQPNCVGRYALAENGQRISADIPAQSEKGVKMSHTFEHIIPWVYAKIQTRGFENDLMKSRTGWRAPRRTFTEGLST